VGVNAKFQNPRGRLDLVVLLANTLFVAIPLIVVGEDFYSRWWHVHLINQIAGVLLVPVGIMASFFIALFVQVGTADRGFRVFITILGSFFIVSGFWNMFGHGLSWASLAEGSLLFWGLGLVLAAGLGGPK
jgi:hypothetical protein